MRHNVSKATWADILYPFHRALSFVAF